jgi:insertion element IS1 protein InsB
MAMIIKTIVYNCRICGSENIVKNGHNEFGSQQYHCHDCGTYRVLEPKSCGYSEEERQEIQRACHERVSMRGLERIFKISRGTVYRWLVSLISALPNLRDTLLPGQTEDVLELDEVWSFVHDKGQKLWIWTVLCRRTRQILAFVIGDHSQDTCLKLWSRIPDAYRRCQSFSDFWKAYQVLPDTHQQVGKDSGETAHIERWYCTLRQRLARLVRKSLSFSKQVSWHHRFIKWFIADYNLNLLSSLTA